MNRKRWWHANTVFSLLIGLFLTFLGIKFILLRSDAWNLTIELTAAALILYSCVLFFQIFSKNTENRFKTLITAVLALLVGLAILVYPILIPRGFEIFFAIMTLINGAVLLITAIKLKKDGAKWFWTLIRSLLYLFLGRAMLKNLDHIVLLTILLGIYVLSYGLDILGDAIASLRGKSKVKKKVRFRMSLPVFLTAFMPKKAFLNFNKRFQEEPQEMLLASSDIKGQKPNLEVYIHSRDGLIEGTGHVDIALNDTVYSYGNYDSNKWILGGLLAEGTMVTMGRQEHIDQSIEDEHKILVVYGLVLNEKNMKRVEKRLKEIFEQSYEWKCPAQLAEEAGEDPTQFKDVASQYYLNTNSDTYVAPSGKVFHYDMGHKIPTRYRKFKKGNPFKTYFALQTNCVGFADTIVGKSGIDLLRVYGVITPGAYMSYLNDLFERPDTIVVSRQIYSQQYQPENPQRAEEIV